jgi:hypothetical protein
MVFAFLNFCLIRFPDSTRRYFTMEEVWASSQVICLVLTIYVIAIGFLTLVIPYIKRKMNPSSPSATLSSSQSPGSGIKCPRGIKVSRWMFIFCSIAYSLMATIRAIHSPSFSSITCSRFSKFAFFFFWTHKTSLYLFLFFKARVIQEAVTEQQEWNWVNKFSFSGIVRMTIYTIIGASFMNAEKASSDDLVCVFNTPEYFYVIYFIGFFDDLILSSMLLYQFIHPLQLHVADMKQTMQIKRSKDHGNYDIPTVIRINLVFGTIAAVSAVASFVAVGWITYSRNFEISPAAIPISSIVEISIANSSVFIISSKALWKYFLCRPCFDKLKRSKSEENQTQYLDMVSLGRSRS